MMDGDLEPVNVECPYCGEPFATAADPSAGDSRYVEDCPVCCQPIVFDLTVDPVDGTVQVSVDREND